MNRPAPKKNAECPWCATFKPLLMPVQYAPGFAEMHWSCICLACRLNLRSDEYMFLASDMIHHPSKDTRDAYPEWCAKESF